MRISRVIGIVLVSLFAFSLAAAPVSAQDNPGSERRNPCAPGQPPDRPPGQPPRGDPPRRPEDRPPYPPGKCQLRTSSSTAAQGSTLTASGDGFVPGETVRLTLGGVEVGQATAGSDGVFTTEIAIPRNAPLGTQVLSATGSAQELTTNIEVLAAGASRGGARSAPLDASDTLPRTGALVVAQVGLSAALILGGAVLVLTTRRRRASAP